MVLQLRFLVRCDEDDAIDEVFVVGAVVAVVAVVSPMSVVENEDSTMNSMDYEKISVVAISIGKIFNQISIEYSNESDTTSIFAYL